MGLFDFVKDAGAALFGGSDDKAEIAKRDLDEVLADKKKGQTLTELIRGMDMDVEDVRVKFLDGRATIEGKAASQAEKEKVVLLVGNTQGVAQVDDRLIVAAARVAEKAPIAEPEATMYTVKSGDSLSKIAKAHYGDAMKYMVIFEANTPMLKDPNKIYPGQTLRIPPLGE